DIAAFHELTGLALDDRFLKAPAIRDNTWELMSHGFEGRDSKRFIERRHHEQRAISKQSRQRGAVDRMALAKEAMILDAAAELGRNTQVPGPDNMEAACRKTVMDCRKRIQELPAAFAREVDADEEHVLSAVILV